MPKPEALKRLEKQFRSFSSGVNREYWLDHLVRIRDIISMVLVEERAEKNTVPTTREA